MKFFDRFSKNHEAAQPSESANNWDMASNDFEAQAELSDQSIEQAEQQLAKRERQERKLIATFLHGPSSLAESDVSISEQERQTVYDELASGRIDNAHKSRILQELATPVHRSPERTIDKLNDKHELRILTFLSGTGFDFWQSASIYDLQSVIDRFPTPYELAPSEASLLDNIKTHNSPQKYAEYVDAMEDFKTKVYGKRYEYYNAMESLQQKANQDSATAASRTEVINAFANTTPLPRAEKQAQSIELHRLSSQEQQEILQNGQIDGDAFQYNGMNYQLTPEILKDLGLAPNYSFKLDDAQINLSNPYKVGSHSAITAYVQTKQGTNICSYYRSNSQGIWRLLPDYVSSNNPNKPIDWFGKGYNEESLNLPGETQAMLEQISALKTETPIDPINAAFAFAGTAKRYNSKDEYRQFNSQHALRGRHYTEVDSAPSFNLGATSLIKNPPESLDLTGLSAPDFSQNQAPYETNTTLYGQIQVDHIPSADGSLQYTFNRDSRNQAWLSNIEIKDAPISSFGLRTKWASAGDYGTPLYEYTRQANGYGDPNQTKGNYTNMWTNYLSRMPLIQKYLASRKR